MSSRGFGAPKAAFMRACLFHALTATYSLCHMLCQDSQGSVLIQRSRESERGNSSQAATQFTSKKHPCNPTHCYDGLTCLDGRCCRADDWSCCGGYDKRKYCPLNNIYNVMCNDGTCNSSPDYCVGSWWSSGVKHNGVGCQTANASVPVKEDGVSALYTFGAPPVSNPPLTNALASDGCFAGHRTVLSIAGNLDEQINDIVPSLGVSTKHPRIRPNTVKFTNRRRSWKDYTKTSSTLGSCGDVDPPRLPDRWFLSVSEIRRALFGDSEIKKKIKKNSEEKAQAVEIHIPAVYLAAVSARHEYPMDIKMIQLAGGVSTYETDKEVRVAVSASGMHIINKDIKVQTDTTFFGLFNGDDYILLVQDPASLDCAVVFEGTDPNSFSDIATNLDNANSAFCGFSGVHRGFRNELRSLMKSSIYQNQIRPSLGKCRRVFATGHSLGGALATLFAACANAQPSNDPDFKLMGWQNAGAQRLCPSECYAPLCAAGSSHNGGRNLAGDDDGRGSVCTQHCSRYYSGTRYCGAGSDYKSQGSLDCTPCSTAATKVSGDYEYVVQSERGVDCVRGVLVNDPEECQKQACGATSHMQVCSNLKHHDGGKVKWDRNGGSQWSDYVGPGCFEGDDAEIYFHTTGSTGSGIKGRAVCKISKVGVEMRRIESK